MKLCSKIKCLMWNLSNVSKKHIMFYAFKTISLIKSLLAVEISFHSNVFLEFFQFNEIIFTHCDPER